MKIGELKKLAVYARKITMQMIGSAGKGHVGGSLSIIEVLIALYYKVMRVNPADPGWSDRDRLVLSKGHAGPGLYAVLAMKGYFDMSEIFTLNGPGTNLPSHCDMNRTRGIDMTTGSLGQGLSAAVGMAVAGKMDGKNYTVYCIIGDGESQEGQIWEAAMYAAQQKLDNLIVFTDNNKKEIDGYVKDINEVEPLDKKWESFGWKVLSVDGHDFKEILTAIEEAKAWQGGPCMVILDTVKGRGVSFTEGVHSMPVTAEDVQKALDELDEKGRSLLLEEEEHCSTTKT